MLPYKVKLYPKQPPIPLIKGYPKSEFYR